MKKTKIALISSIFLFIFINVSLAQAGTVTITVKYFGDNCPRSDAYVREVYNRNYIVGVSDESGYTYDYGFKPDTIYKFKAFWPDLGNQFGGQEIIVTDEYGNGNVILGYSTTNYPNGTETCGDSECDGYKYCYSGSPPYTECYHNDTPTHPTTSTWNSECDTKKCCLCSANNKANPTQNYDSSQNQDCPFCQKCTGLNACGYQSGEDLKNECPEDSCKYGYCNGAGACNMKSSATDCGTCVLCNGLGDCNVFDSTQNSDCNPFDISEITTCDWIPDDYHPTWDSRNPFDSQCTGFNQCSQGNSEITHTCSVSSCSAECDSTHSCQNKCIGDTRYYSGSCNSLCSCDYSIEDCNTQDGWYNTLTTQWIDLDQCKEKEQVWQDYRDYTCSAVQCTYSVTQNRWFDTGQTRNKQDGTVCDGSPSGVCDVQDTCQLGTCVDNIQPNTYVCRSSVGFCDVEEKCDGSSKLCPTDSYKPSSELCRASSGDCDIAEYCTGLGSLCPSDGVRSSGYVCAVETGQCDASDTCDGVTKNCNEIYAPSGTSCNDGLFCNVGETCNGNGQCASGSSRDCSSNDLQSISTCDNIPDNYHPTWDFRNVFTSVCDENQDKCTTGDSTINHICSKSSCGAQCGSDSDCPVGQYCGMDCKCSVWASIYSISGSYPINDIEEHNSKLHFASNDNKIYVFDGSIWNTIQSPVSVSTIKPFKNKLYVAGGPGEIYRYDEPTWTKVFSIDEPMTVEYLKMLGVYNDRLYAGSYLDKPAKLYYSTDGTTWHEDTGFSSILDCSGPFCSIDSFANDSNNKLYITSGGKIYRYDGSWSTFKTYGDVYAFQDMKIFNNKLYFATRDASTSCPMYAGGSGFCGRVIEYDGTNWNIRFNYSYPTYTNGYWMYSLEAYNGRLYAGTANRIYMSSDGTNWELTYNSASGAQYALDLKTWNSRIYVGFGNGLIAKDDMLEPLNLKLLSPANTTYTTSSVPLTFTINRPVSWIGYSLDGKPNVTITTNTTLTGLTNSGHNIILYASEAIGKTSTSKVYFTVSVPTQTCTCTNWLLDDTGCCRTRTCTPRGCAIEKSCNKICIL